MQLRMSKGCTETYSGVSVENRAVCGLSAQVYRDVAVVAGRWDKADYLPVCPDYSERLESKAQTEIFRQVKSSESN